MISIRSITFVALIIFAASSEAFTVGSASSARASTSLNIFGNALKNAFGNDEDLGKVQNAGLSNGPQQNDKVTLNGKQVKAVVGQKVSVIAAQNRVKISYNCKAGDCGTCIVNINGRKQKACQMTIPNGKCNINTL
jgi:ferredoxin